MNMSNYLSERVLNHLLGKSTYTPPQTFYVGLVSDLATPEDLEEGLLDNEIIDYDGDRKEINFTLSSIVSNKGVSSNNNMVIFNALPNTVVKYAIVCDSATEGNILYWIEAENERQIYSGDSYSIPENNLLLQIT